MALDLLLIRDQEAHQGFDQRMRQPCLRLADPVASASLCLARLHLLARALPSRVFVHLFTRHLASRHWPRRECKWWRRWGHTRDYATTALSRLFCCSSSSFCSRRCHRPAPGPTIELQHAQYGYEVGKLISSPSSFQHHSSPTHIIYHTHIATRAIAILNSHLTHNYSLTISLYYFTLAHPIFKIRYHGA